MDNLVKQIADKAEITQEQAEKAVLALREYIQSKLPPAMHGMIDNFLTDDNDF